MHIYIDADGCPVKDEVYKVAARLKFDVTVVANKALSVPLDPRIEMKVVGGAFDAADDWIAENAAAGDLVVTADILLAERCLARKAKVLGPKGQEFTEDSIGSAVANRELMTHLRQLGQKGGPAPMEKKDRSQFLNKLDQILQALLRTYKKT